MTAEPTPSPSTVRRQDTINEAIIAAERLVSVLRGYRAAKRDGFPMAHLARIDAVLARVTDKTTQVIGGEQDDLIATGAAVEEEERIRLSTSRLRFTVLTPEPTVPTSLIAHPIQSAGDCN